MRKVSMGMIVVAISCCFSASSAGKETQSRNRPPGRFVDMGGWSLYLNCAGKGSPTVVVETGLGDFAMDWVLVQPMVAARTRICTYDRAGYGFSDAGPMPRTYDQITSDLHRLLERAGERGPFVLAGHSFGGPLIRYYAQRYPEEVAGLAFIEASTEEAQFMMKGKPTKVRSFASGRTPPQPGARAAGDPVLPRWGIASPDKVDPIYAPLPLHVRQWRAWAEQQPKLKAAMSSETDWSPEYMQRMHDTPQEGILGNRPTIVLTRSKSGYENQPPPYNSEMEKDRVETQKHLVALSTRSHQVIAETGHNVNLENPKAAADAILDVVMQIRKDSHH